MYAPARHEADGRRDPERAPLRMKGEAVSTLTQQSRRAGWIYLLSGFSAPFGLIYVPGRIVAAGDATATAEHLRASEMLLRLGIASELVTAALFLSVALVLYRLLKPVDAGHARAMVVLYAVAVPISFVNVLFELAALQFAQGAPYMMAFDPAQRDALAMLCMKLHGQGLMLAEVFWGLWLLPMGMLVFRSGWFPRALGVWLVANGVAYVLVSAVGIVAPQYSAVIRPFALPIQFGELAFMLWCIVVGARPKAELAAAA